MKNNNFEVEVLRKIVNGNLGGAREMIEENKKMKENNKIKVYLKQVSPEAQDCYLWNDIKTENIEKICIDGNHNFYGITTEEYDTFIKSIKEIDYYLTPEGEIAEWYDSFEDFVNDYFGVSSKPRYNKEELREWKKFFVSLMTKNEDYLNCDNIARGLSIMTGRKYVWHSIVGCSQDEWNILYVPINVVDYKYYETVYFDLGTQWLLSETEDFQDATIYYSLKNNIEDVKQDIAENFGCKPDELKIYRWTGKHYVDDYEEC